MGGDKIGIDLEFAFAISDLPEVPNINVLSFLAEASYSVPTSVKDKGKELQAKHGLEVIPPVAELEWAAGLWFTIREALIQKGQAPL